MRKCACIAEISTKVSEGLYVYPVYLVFYLNINFRVFVATPGSEGRSLTNQCTVELSCSNAVTRCVRRTVTAVSPSTAAP